MFIILKHRGEGKTRDLILRSDETGYRIITSTSKQVEYIKKMAHEMGVIIPDPMDIRSYISCNNYVDEGVLMDEINYCLDTLFNCPVDTITLTYGG